MKLPIILSSVLIISCQLLGTDVVWQANVPESEDSWQVRDAYQVNDEIWLTYVSNDLLPSTQLASSDTIAIDGPAFMITKLIDLRTTADFSPSEHTLLYRVGEDITASYESGQDDGWILHTTFGHAFTESYPWVYILDDNAWFWVTDAGITDGSLSYWLYSTESGWMFTSNTIYPMYWSADQESWTSL